VRERIRYLHYSLSTEQVYVYWVRFFIRWSGRGGQMVHLLSIGAECLPTRNRRKKRYFTAINQLS
jgi:hypothetical protein